MRWPYPNHANKPSVTSIPRYSLNVERWMLDVERWLSTDPTFPPPPVSLSQNPTDHAILPVTMKKPEPFSEAPAGSQDPDREDVRRATAGDMAAFERLYQRHVGRVNSMARWLLDAGDTDDVVQDVFVRMWNRLATFRGEAPFKTWLHRLAVNIILRTRERVRRHETRHVHDETALAGASHQDSIRLLYSDIETAVTNLPPRAREVFVLFDVIGYTHGEIADLLHITANTSRWQLHEARATLRRYLD